jgi:hypothetical protein
VNGVKYQAKIDAQYKDGKGKIRSYQAGEELDWKPGMPKPSKHFEAVGGEPVPVPAADPPKDPPEDPPADPSKDPPEDGAEDAKGKEADKPGKKDKRDAKGKEADKQE